MKQKMQKLCKRVIATVCAASMVLGGILSDVGTVVTQAAADHTLWLVGDSTVCSFNDGYYYPRYGYGTQIGNYLDGTYDVQNLAASGTSSKSFLGSTNYTTLKNGIKEGDTLVIGFGHNDEKYEADRYTDPNGDWETEGSFAKSLYDNYIAVAESKGAQVILCTPIVRRTTGSFSDSQLHITGAGKDESGNSYAGGDYPQAIRDLGDAKKVPVVDLTSLTEDLYTELGAAETLYLHAWTSNKEGSVDNTHLNYYGAKHVAWLFANAVSELEDELDIKDHIDLSEGAPSKDTDLPKAVNSDYKEPEYSSDLKASGICSDYVIGEGDDAVHFKGTAFGDLGGAAASANHILGSDAAGDMRIAVKNNKGKITATADGIAMYYYRVPVGKNFTLSAKATVNGLDTSNSQVAFGLMARDDMYIDLNDSSVASDYVAAGILGGSGCNCFYRRNGSLGGRAALTTEEIAVGSSYNLSIVSNTDGYACTFGKEPTQSKGYDFQLTSVDSDYVYIGMFAARNADISFSNIVLTVDGKEVVNNTKTEYAVTVATAENGTGSVDKATAAKGQKVTLTATPAAGYVLDKWEVVSGDVTIENNLTFTMPESAVEVKPVFKQMPAEWSFRVNGTTNILMGKVGNNSTDAAIEGTVATRVQGAKAVWQGLEIDASASGAVFDTLNRGDWAQVNQGTIIKIPIAETCKVTVVAYSAGKFTVNGTPMSSKTIELGCVPQGDGNDYITIEALGHDYLGSIKVTKAEIEEHSVTVTVSGDGEAHGKVTASHTKAAVGTLVTLTATPESGYVLKGWTVTKGGVTVKDNSFTMPDEDVALEAVFEQKRTEWIFKTDGDKISSFTGDDAALVQNGTQVVAGLTVDATASGAKWDSTTTADSTGAVLINKGTKIHVPVDVPEGGAVKVTVKVVTYTDEKTIGFNVDGKALPEDCNNVSQTIVCEGKNSEVVLEATLDSMWLYQLKVEPVEYAAEGTYDLTTQKLPENLKGVDWGNFKYANDNNQDMHGVQAGGTSGQTIRINLPQKANITLETCGFGAGNTVTATYNGKEATKQEIDSHGKTGCIFTIRGAEGDAEITLTATNTIWIHSLSIEYAFEPGDRKIDVWDLAGLEETDSKLYNNNITPALWVEKDVLTKVASDANPAFSKTGITFGDLTIYNHANDRLYSNVDYQPLKNLIGKGASPGSSIVPTKDADYEKTGYGDYRPAGGYYGNGAGTSTTKYLSLAHVQAGDKIVVYLGSHQYAANGNTIEYTIEGTGAAAGQSEKVTITETEQYKKYEFVAQKSGTYKIYQSNYSPKPMYHRVVRVPGMQVTGKITFPADFDKTDYSLKFVNQSNKQETVATLNEDNTYSVVLAPGYAYNAVLTGATGWGITSATKVLQTEEAEALTGKEKDLAVEVKSTYSFTGKVVGFASGYDTSKLVVEMVPVAGNDVNPNADVVEVTFTDKATLSFTVTLEPDVPYNVRLSGGVSDYQVKSPEEVAENGAYTADIEVELKAKYQVTGGLVDLNGNKLDAKDATLSFVLNETEGEGVLAKTYTYKYPATLTETGYSVELRAGEYEVEAQINGYSTKTHVVVENKAVKKDLLFVAPADTSSLDRVADIYVGYPKKEHNYATVREAVAACARMKPTSEDDRIKIHIAPGTYREQVIVETPYISFVNDEAGKGKEVLLTWYYGIGYQYYSVNNGFYDAESAFDKYEKGTADRWGTSVRITTNATAFRAEGITFENSFNRYITDEEIEDGVEVSGKESIRFVRELGVDVTTKAATERAAAIAVEGAHSEFYNCQFLSSQDTLYTQGDAYFKNCLIEGMTDYIYGQGTCVFDACELSWKGYEAGNTTGGYITAAQTKTDQKGYLFRNCVVTNKSGTAAAGDLGRCWGGVNSKTMFLNTKLESADLITARGWYEMSDTKPKDVPGYQEYNTVSLDGETLDFSNPDRSCHIMTDEAAAAVKVTDYFIGWTPAYYTEEEEDVAFTTAPYLSDNGDMNLLRPGHTLTVHYSLGKANDANDASIIRWYRVKGEEKTLLKTSSAATDKTYKVAAEDTGNKIMAEVTPGTVSGKAGTAQSCTTPETVGEGYEDPSGGSDIELGDGINIFLAGDSTVKDYSAKGMYNSGKALSEGAWGEFLQAYFDPAKVTIQNYAQGGRSSRNFINEGKLDEIERNIKEGDYLFIQFGHNDSSNGLSNHVLDRYAPIGTPVDGVYPSNAGTPDAEGKYTWDCGGTYKWYLKQYIKVAKEKGAIPVLVTPVARMYYNSDGTIKPHHDETLTGFVAADLDDMTTAIANKTNKNKDNSYVKAVKQLAEEEDVLLLDAFTLTENIFVTAYNDAEAANVTPNSTYGQQIMAVGDSTHNNKVGGMIEAAAIASAIQNMGLDISKAVKAPQGMTIKTPDGKNAFTVTNASKLTMYDMLQDYGEDAEYWTTEGQKMIDAIGEKAKELNGSGENPDQYTIIIDRQDGTELVEKVIDPETELTEADLPSDLTREGYTFKGWFDEDGNAITVPYTPEGSMTIKARWEKIVAEDELAITIDKGDGSDLVEKVIKKGTTLTEADLPSTLTREGYIFQGWVDEDGKAITVPYVPTKSMTIRAKWKNNTTEPKIGLQIELAVPNATYVYNGSAIKPAIIVTNNGELLTEGADYTVKYSNNVKAAQATDRKAPTITVTGKGRFTGKTVQTFTIEKKDLSDEDVVKGDIVVAKKGKAVPVLIYNGMKLGTKDYEFVNKADASKKFEESGTIQIQAKANGNYKTDEPITLDVTVVEKLQKLNIVVDTKTKLTYKGEEQTPDIKVYDKDDKSKTTALTEETDYIIVYSGDKTSAGTQKFNVIGMGKYTGSTAKTYKISPLVEKDTTKFEITGVESSYSYKSSGVTLDALEVTYKGDKLAEAQTEKLIAGKDYKVSYSGNKKTGTGKYTITFLGNYKGSTAIKNQTFNIDKASFADLDVEVKSGDKVYSGKANTYKSAPYVLVDGVALKSSEYTVEYSYLDAAGQKVVIGKNKVELAEGENSKEITVTVNCKDKSNYSGTATGTYNVVRKGDNQTDLSKAKIAFKDKAGKAQGKVEYTGKEVYPDSIEIKIDKNTSVTLTSENWDADANISVEFVNNIEKGKASVIVSAKDGGSYVGSKTATFNVVAQKLKDEIWSNIATFFGL